MPDAIISPINSTYERNRKWAKEADSYSTTLTRDEEEEFQRWVKENKVPFDLNDPSPNPDYDMRGFWRALKSGDERAVTAIDPHDGQRHFPDIWKTPYHESFSRESMWAKDGAPTWNERDQLVTTDGRVVYDAAKEAKRRKRR